MSTPYSQAAWMATDLGDIVFVMIKGEWRHLHGLKDSLDFATKLNLHPLTSLSYHQMTIPCSSSLSAASMPWQELHPLKSLSHCHMPTILS